MLISFHSFPDEGLKQHDPLRKRKAVTAGARGGRSCFAKEAIIKGQSDYLCVSADPLCPLSTFFFFISRLATLSIMSLVWNTLTKKPHSFVCNRKQDGRSLTAKRLKGCGASAKTGRGAPVTVGRGERVVKGQRGRGALRPGPHTPSNLPPENCQRSQEVIQTRSPRSCSHISIEVDEREPVTLHPLPPPTSPLCPSSYPLRPRPTVPACCWY